MKRSGRRLPLGMPSSLPQRLTMARVTTISPLAKSFRRSGVFFIFVVVLPLALSAAQSDNNRVAYLYQRGLAGDGQAITECITLLEKILKSDSGNQLARVYLGSVYTLRSRDLWFGPEKLSALKQGLTLMDQAASAAPDDAHVLLVRAVTNESMPSFLGRRKVARQALYSLVEMTGRNPNRLNATDQQLLYLNAGLAAKQNGEKDLALKFWKLGLTNPVDAKLTAELNAALASI